ncbi:hypothetical protein DPMN_173608 [Dreissena polymorpha]|uniref:Uncharacterized protein n=1 Tax=Dreissena polymorpha TaxID=45954 RepID=A0A9D4E4F1_DREPO|nr:hypothetical protein DPMN_173608 [Dreissena polymorpha]
MDPFRHHLRAESITWLHLSTTEAWHVTAIKPFNNTQAFWRVKIIISEVAEELSLLIENLALSVRKLQAMKGIECQITESMRIVAHETGNDIKHIF